MSAPRMSTVTEDEITEEARRRFHFDAEHHSRATLAAQFTDAYAKTQAQPLTEQEFRVALFAASVALVVAERNPLTGRAETMEEAMHRHADAFTAWLAALPVTPPE